MAIPQNRVTVGATNYDNVVLSGQVLRVENGFDIATLTFPDQYCDKRATITAGATTVVNVKDATDGSYTALLSGVGRFRTEGIDPEAIVFKAESMGYPFAECLVGQEYGMQSDNPTLDTLKEILTDASAGIIDKWVEKVLNTAVDSQYAFDTTYVDTITGTINYLYFPFKPASKCLADICNIVQAIKGTSAGPHWIVTTSGSTNYLRVKLVDGTQTGWTKYYGNSQANATLTQGVDFLKFNAQQLTSEANYILNHSAWVWPGNRDYATEIGTWSDDPFTSTAYSTSVYKVGIKSLEATIDTPQVFNNFTYPSSEDLHLDLTKAGGKYSIPQMAMWLRRNSTLTGSMGLYIAAKTDASHYWQCNIDIQTLLPNADEWQWVNFPIGENWRTVYNNPSGVFQGWGIFGGDWSDINFFYFSIYSNKAAGSKLYIDGLHLTGTVLRGAYNSTLIAANGLKTRIINDPFGKDDTLKASDDSGTIARLAYAELLRAQTTPTVGTLTTPSMIKDILPGQLVHIHARPNLAGTFQINADFRVTQILQQWQTGGEYTTTLNVTSDVTNSYARAAYDSVNETIRNQRPEFQDRQATAMKMREIDITQTILAKDYP
jgi:hypothetical protein